MATAATGTAAAQMAGGLSQSLDSSPQSGATSGDAKGGTTGNFSFGNVNFAGTQSNSSGGVNWLVVGGVVAAVAVFYFLSK